METFKRNRDNNNNTEFEFGRMLASSEQCISHTTINEEHEEPIMNMKHEKIQKVVEMCFNMLVILIQLMYDAMICIICIECMYVK